MSFVPGEIWYRDGANLDAFGRLRVSDPQTIYGAGFEYGAHPLVWESVLSGTGTAVHSTTTGAVTLRTGGAANGARALRRTKVYWRYQPGKSQLVKMTGTPVLAGTVSGFAEWRVGYYDDNNGVYFGQDETGYFVARRTSTSGSAVTTKAYRANWDDPMDGSGVSGITIDFTKTQILVIDLQWLGVGRVRFGFQIAGQLYYCHSLLQANTTLTLPYMKTANLPLSYEVINDGGTGADIQLSQICGAIESEGGVHEEASYSFAVGTAGATVSCPNSATLTPLFSVRLRDTFNGLTYRGHVHPNHYHFLVQSSAIYYEILWNATLTGATWAGLADTTYSGVEFDLAATSYTGGVRMNSGYVAAGSGSTRGTDTVAAISQMLLARTYANVRDIITVAARGVGGAASVSAQMDFEEQY